MAYYRSESNVYCDSIKKTIAAGQTDNNVVVKANGPCRISGILAKFASATSGDFTVDITRNGVTVNILKVTLDSNQSVVASDINVWLPEAGSSAYKATKLSITNGTQASADVLIDYAY